MKLSNISQPYRGLALTGLLGTSLSLFGAFVAPNLRSPSLQKKAEEVLRPEGQTQGPAQWYLDQLSLPQPDEK